ncbi:IS5/IS1182 family transposase [Kitasatospora purpeofusca]|uniref:IS5/IS1182 family transposase n=1 Tax=Kitasatospora purpeofusca TaxID=67352 RepID=UPI0038210214
MVDAVRYPVAGGITWRAVPADFPARDRVYAFFRRRRDKVLVAEFHDRLRDRVREAAGRDPGADRRRHRRPVGEGGGGAGGQPGIGRREEGVRPQEAHRRGTLRLLPAVLVTAAFVTDREAGGTLLERMRERHWRISPARADGGRTGRPVGLARDVLRIMLSVVERGDDATGFTVLPKRRPVERTFASLMRSRRPARDHGTCADTSEAMIRWSVSMVMSRRHARRAR